MATTQTLQKKLNGVRSIQKVSKALRTAATVKFSRLSSICGNFSVYAERCRGLYLENRELFECALPKANAGAPVCFVIMAGNKGMCGGFNSDLYNFALEQIKSAEKCRTILVGRWLKTRFEENLLSYDRAFAFDDLPSYEETVELYEYIKESLSVGEISGVELIYPRYGNMMRQIPTRCELFGASKKETASVEPLFFPDRVSIIEGMSDNVMISVLHERVLECAMGAQAATLMTMRSAYDTATEYSRRLEAEINQKRQSRVTADVIETSSEFSREVD